MGERAFIDILGTTNEVHTAPVFAKRWPRKMRFKGRSLIEWFMHGAARPSASPASTTVPSTWLTTAQEMMASIWTDRRANTASPNSAGLWELLCFLMLPTSSLLGEDGSASAKVDEMSARIYVSGFYRFCLKIPSRTSMADYLSNMQRIGQYVCRRKTVLWL